MLVFVDALTLWLGGPNAHPLLCSLRWLSNLFDETVSETLHLTLFHLSLLMSMLNSMYLVLLDIVVQQRWQGVGEVTSFEAMRSICQRNSLGITVIRKHILHLTLMQVLKKTNSIGKIIMRLFPLVITKLL